PNSSRYSFREALANSRGTPTPTPIPKSLTASASNSNAGPQPPVPTPSTAEERALAEAQARLEERRKAEGSYGNGGLVPVGAVTPKAVIGPRRRTRRSDGNAA